MRAEYNSLAAHRLKKNSELARGSLPHDVTAKGSETIDFEACESMGKQLFAGRTDLLTTRSPSRSPGSVESAVGSYESAVKVPKSRKGARKFRFLRKNDKEMARNFSVNFEL